MGACTSKSPGNDRDQEAVKKLQGELRSTQQLVENNNNELQEILAELKQMREESRKQNSALEQEVKQSIGVIQEKNDLILESFEDRVATDFAVIRNEIVRAKVDMERLANETLFRAEDITLTPAPSGPDVVRWDDVTSPTQLVQPFVNLFVPLDLLQPTTMEVEENLNVRTGQDDVPEWRRHETVPGTSEPLIRWATRGRVGSGYDGAAYSREGGAASAFGDMDSSSSSSSSSTTLETERYYALLRERSAAIRQKHSFSVEESRESVLRVEEVGRGGLGIVVQPAPNKTIGNYPVARLRIKGFQKMPPGEVNPSMAAGLRVGDVIERVDGEYAYSHQEMVAMLRHTNGSVRLTICKSEERAASE